MQNSKLTLSIIGLLMLTAFDAVADQKKIAAEGYHANLGRRVLSPTFKHDGRTPIKVAFFDADGTLRVSKSGKPAANSPTDVRLLPGRAAKLKALRDAGFLIGIVSNQAGIPQYVSLEDADGGLAYTGQLLHKRGGSVHYYDFAEVHDDNRKPAIGMARRLEKLIQDQFGVSIDKAASFMVGDGGYQRAQNGRPADIRPDGKPGTDFSNADRLFAEHFGIPFFYAPDFFKRIKK